MFELDPKHEVPFLFLAILVVGMAALLPSIHLALSGSLEPFQLVLVALLAMCISDLVWYLAGRLAPAEGWLCWAPLERLRQRTRGLGGGERSGRAWLFASRFLYGTRIPTCIACGLARMRYPTYLAVNLASALGWLAVLFLLAWSVGSVTDLLLEERAVRLTPTVLVALGFLIPVVRRARRRVRARPEAGGRFERVSAVIPACNEEAHLAAAIASIRAQAVPAEVVVVENGSTDATAEIAYELADRVVRTPLPAGYSRARNLGAAAARGDLLVFLDADSRMAPDALAEILAAARRGTFGTVIGRPDPPRPSYRLFFFFKNLWHRLGLYKGVLGGLLYCDAELFRRVGGFDERMVLDELHDFSRRARRAGGGYRLVPRTWAATSMRRFDEIGLWRSFRFWSQLRFRLPASRRFRAELEAYPLFRLPGGPRDAVTVWSRDSGQERPRIQVLAEPAGET